MALSSDWADNLEQHWKQKFDNMDEELENDIVDGEKMDADPRRQSTSTTTRPTAQPSKFTYEERRGVPLRWLSWQLLRTFLSLFIFVVVNGLWIAFVVYRVVDAVVLGVVGTLVTVGLFLGRRVGLISEEKRRRRGSTFRPSDRFGSTISNDKNQSLIDDDMGRSVHAAASRPIASPHTPSNLSLTKAIKDEIDPPCSPQEIRELASRIRGRTMIELLDDGTYTLPFQDRKEDEKPSVENISIVKEEKLSSTVDTKGSTAISTPPRSSVRTSIRVIPPFSALLERTSPFAHATEGHWVEHRQERDSESPVVVFADKGARCRRSRIMFLVDDDDDTLDENRK